ncbi:SMI1/KNR4 family protein [Sorangium sp. So ce1335]|uniref:SMI1/KNR4 family protein n=1 Tax=Sorangium sp. So ce1335 TaxID=3133335 RepID=UPI003F612B5B
MRMRWRAEHQLLIDAGVAVAPGLTETELDRAESAIGARFPPDLRSFLSEGLPVGGRFPDWRAPDSTEVRRQLDWPFEGIAFDIEHNAFWWDAWGVRPSGLPEALQIARAAVAEAPRLIPIRGHRYIPAEPALAGNPVFSVYQTDIICYGSDLATYLRREFHRPPHADAAREEVRRIRFWSELVDANG